MSIGARIAELRRERGMSQAALAAATGVSRSAVAQWETDRAGQVSGNLSRIAAVLDVSVEVLLHGPAARGPEGLTGDELALLRLYRQCTDGTGLRCCGRRAGWGGLGRVDREPAGLRAFW